MIDPSEVAQRYLTFKPMPPGNYTIVVGEEPAWFKLANEIRAYGEQCRRAGAEAMREAIAKPFDDMGLFDIDGATLAESIRKTPPALVEKLRALDAEPPEASFTNLDEMMTYLNDTPAEAASPAAGSRPMDSAPTDGTVITLFARCKTATAPVPVFGHWDSERAEWIELTFSPNVPVGLVPLSWRPRPSFSYAPPTVGSPSEEARAG